MQAQLDGGKLCSAPSVRSLSEPYFSANTWVVAWAVKPRGKWKMIFSSLMCLHISLLLLQHYRGNWVNELMCVCTCVFAFACTCSRNLEELLALAKNPWGETWSVQQSFFWPLPSLSELQLVPVWGNRDAGHHHASLVHWGRSGWVRPLPVLLRRKGAQHSPHLLPGFGLEVTPLSLRAGSRAWLSVFLKGFGSKVEDSCVTLNLLIIWE